MAQQRRLDLPRLDAEAAHLDLLVGAAEELQAAVRQPAGEVAGAVEPLAAPAEGIGDEALGGQLRPAESSRAPPPRRRRTAPRERRSAPAARAVEQMDAQVADRPADRHPPRVLPRRAHPAGDVDRDLGRPVLVVQRHAGEAGEEALAQRRRQRLAAGEDLAQRAALRRPPPRAGRAASIDGTKWTTVTRRSTMARAR